MFPACQDVNVVHDITAWGYGFRVPASKSAKPTWMAGPGMTGENGAKQAECDSSRKFDGEFARGSQTYAGTGTLRVSW
jgi:hypothetical protein